MNRQLKIKVGEFFLNFEKTDLKIAEENNSFLDEFKVSHNSYPLKIVEDLNCVEALGDNSISSFRKKKTYDAIIYIGSSRHFAVLEITKYLKGFRMANIKFGSEIISILDKKIYEFFENFNVKNQDVDVFPYVEESIDDVEAFEEWNNWQIENSSKIFPEVDFQFPNIKWPDKFGQMEEGNEWFSYRGKLNYRKNGNLKPNEFYFNEELPTAEQHGVNNRNVLSPQIFMLSPLYKVVESLGYKVKGSFPVDNFMRRILFSNFKDNLTVVSLVFEQTNYELSPGNFQTPNFQDFANGLTNYYREFDYVNPGVGDWKIVYKFDMGGQDPSYFFKFYLSFAHEEYIIFEGSITENSSETIFEGELNFTITEDNLNHYPKLFFLSTNQFIPENHTLYLQKDAQDINVHQFHPTIDFKRFLPDWSFADYINNLQTFFNLKVDFDDVAKTFTVNFNEKDYLIDGKTYNLRNQFLIEDRNNIEFESFLFQFDNEEDVKVLINNQGEFYNGVKNEFTKEIRNKFKIVALDYDTARYSEALEDKGGVGLMIYSPVDSKIVSTFNNKGLFLGGPLGIISNFWAVWINFRMNAHNFTLSGPVTNTELIMITKLQKIYSNGQLSLLKKIEYKESNKGFLDAKIELESVNL